MKRMVIAASTMVLVFVGAAMAQHVVGTINATGNWTDIVLYQTGGKFFIADYTNAQILVYDIRTLAYLDTISVSAFSPYGPQCLALHEGTGTLYAALYRVLPASSSTIVIINADTHAIIDSIEDFNRDAGLIMDESRARVYVFAGHSILTAIDVNTNTVVGSLNVGYLFNPSGARVQFEFGNVLNPVTGELVFSCLGGDAFAVVDGPNLTGELITAVGSNGRGGTWNPHENKLYITRALWNGYFIYDRDTGTAKIAESYNDGTYLFYSQATNRIYSSAEVNWDTTVIEGDTDEWQDIEVGDGGLTGVGFVTATRHAYFARETYVFILDEDTLTVMDSVPGCGDAAVMGGTNIVVDQNHRRVFIRSHWCTGDDDPGNSCVLIIDDGEDDLLGTWDGQGVYFRNSETGNWIKLSSPADLIAAGDLDGDYTDDLIGIWPTQGGVWANYSKTGSWAKLSSTATHIGSGDMNGDGRKDFLGTWDGQGVYYRDSISGVWVKLASPATLITAGDLDGDNKDDLIGIWPTQGGVWVKYSKTGAWAKLSSTARDIGAGDMNGDGRDDLLATWDGQGVYYRDSFTGSWVKMATPADQVTCGDIDEDGKEDLIGIWAGQGGVWIKYSETGTWAKLSSTAGDIATGLMRGGAWASSGVSGAVLELPAPAGGYAEGPLSQSGYLDLSAEGPGGPGFMFQEENNSIPQSTAKALAVPGPGEPGFVCVEEVNLVPREGMEKNATGRSVPKGQKK